MKSAILLTFVAFCFQACTPHEYIDPALFPVHTVTIVNQSSSEFTAEISTFSRVDGLHYDYFDGASYEHVRLDSSYRVERNGSGLLIQDLLVDDKGQLKIREIVNRITKLEVYKILNSDTLRATLDLDDFNVWSYSNDNAPFPQNVEHYYKLTIRDSHFD